MRCLRFEFPVFRWFYDRWRHQLTWNGKWAVIALALSMPGLLAIDTALPTIFFALLTLLLLTGVLSYWSQPRLKLRWATDEVSEQGAVTTLAVYITNPSDRRLHELSLGLEDVPPSWRVCNSISPTFQLQPGETVRRVVEVVPDRRGCFTLPSLRVESILPLHLFQLGTTHRFQQELIVLPVQHRFDSAEYLAMVQRSGPYAARESHSTGTSDDYVASREYQTGINVRRWDYRAWARLGRPIVCEFGRPARAVVGLWIDTRAATGNSEAALRSYENGSDEGVEQRVALAASWIEAVLADDDELQFVASPSGRHELDGLTSADALSTCRRWLAQLPTLPSDHLTPVEMWPGDGAATGWLVCLSDRPDESVVAQIVQWEQAGWQVVLVRSGERSGRFPNERTPDDRGTDACESPSSAEKVRAK